MKGFQAHFCRYNIWTCHCGEVVGCNHFGSPRAHKLDLQGSRSYLALIDLKHTCLEGMTFSCVLFSLLLMAVYPAALFWPWCWGFVHVGVPPPREAGDVLRLRSRGRAAEQKNTVTLVPGALWPSLVYLLGPFSQCSEPWLPSDTVSNNLAGYLWDLKIRNSEKETNLPWAHICCSLNNSCHFHIHLFITFGDHISSADDNASFRGCSETEVLFIFLERRAFIPSLWWLRTDRVAWRIPLIPAPFLVLWTPGEVPLLPVMKRCLGSHPVSGLDSILYLLW